MYDGAELAKAIAANPRDAEAALSAYEQALFPRSASAGAEAHQTFKVCFGDATPQSLLDLFSPNQPVESPTCDPSISRNALECRL